MLVTKKRMSQQQTLSERRREIVDALITGYLRLIVKIGIKDEIPNSIIKMFVDFYGIKLYLMILNNKTLEITLCDMTSTINDTIKFTSNKGIRLTENDNDNDYGDSDFGGLFKVGITNITNNEKIINLSNTITNKIDNYDKNKYNVIFKCGKDKECGIIFYSKHFQDISGSFNTFYYKLPSLPFFNGDYNNPVYSEKYGLITFVTKQESQIAYLNLNSNNNNNDDKLEWKCQQLPKYLKTECCIAPNYCLINDEELFIVNGMKRHKDYFDNSHYFKNTSIYNLQTGQIIQLKDNPYPTACSAIYYNNNDKFNKNTIWIGGGTGHYNPYMTTVHSFNLIKQKYIDNLPKTNNSYSNAKLWLNKNGTTIHICCIDKFGKFNYEFIDIRNATKGWMSQNNINELAYSVWSKHDITNYLSIINWV